MKFQACCWSFLELGATALSREESWFTVMTELETVVAQVSAGLSQLFACITILLFETEEIVTDSTYDFGLSNIIYYMIDKNY